MTKGKYFFIQSRLNGLVLDIKGEACENGSQVITWPKKEGDPDNQLWAVDPVSKTIRSKMNSSMCLDIDDDNTLVINDFDPGNDNQKWIISGDCLENSGNGDRVLDVAGNDESEGARICAWDKHGEANQCWDFDFLPTRYFFIRSDMNGKVIDIKGGNSEEGTKIIMWEQHEEPQDNQLWYENEYGVICSKLNDMAIDASGENSKSMRVRPFNVDDEGQLWTVRRGRIINRSNPERVLDIKRAEDKNGAKLIAYEPNDGDNQKWSVDFIE